MLGSRSPVPIVLFTLFTFCLLTAVTAGAQTPVTAVNKPVVELTAPVTTPALNVGAPASDETAKPSNARPAESAKPATPAAKPETTTTAAAPSTMAPATAAGPSTTAPATMTSPAAVTAPVSAPPGTTAPTPPMAQCTRTVKADVVAIPKAIMLNRLGATIPNAFVFALRSDLDPNTMQLRPGKRPRPIVLRANVGDCLQVKFTNRIPPTAFNNATPNSPAVATQEVSLHIQGQEWTSSSKDDGTFVGRNPSALASATPAPSPMPGVSQTYTLFVKHEGTYLLYTMGDTEAQPLGQLSRGLFGALNVQPAKAEWYRSQVTQQDLALATKKGSNGQPLHTADGQPVIDYNAVYPAGSKWPDGTPIQANTPILNMLDKNLNIVHSDLTAIITGPNAGRFEGSTGPNNPEPPCNAANDGAGATDPLFCANPSAPDRKQPYREFTIIYHEVGQVATQAFPVFTDPQMASTVNAGFDGFAINYGTGGIGAEVYANRIGVGPMGGCVDCKFEEFFLSAWSVGDPAMLVDRPANSSTLPAFATEPASPPVPQSTPPPPVLCTAAQLGDTGSPDPTCAGTKTPANGTPYSMKPLIKATKAYYPDDPSNVYHSYINDHTKFRIHHGGTVATHVHHQHAHQWLMSPNSDEGAYLDSQMISPGASYTLEMTFNGSGNRNKVVGDSIFHCHFYPHFAAGMWAMWRTHDTFEEGTELDANGIPKPDSRALPDGEIMAGTPSPALVPMPTLPMAPMPSKVFIKNGQVVYGTPLTPDPTGSNVSRNPGFPYFIPGIAGMRAPHPPLDFAPDGNGGFMDGGLPRHVTTGGTISYEKHDQFDWSKDFGTLSANQLPEDGTNVEKVAMKFFGIRCRNSFTPDGTANNCGPTPSTSPQMTQGAPKGFVLNGLPLGPQPGAPFADPAVDDNGKPINFDPVSKKQTVRRYKAAAIQLDVILNKQRWHYPQQRILSLWNDVGPTLAFTPNGGGRAPEPLFFRGNSGDIIEYWHTNLVPNYYLVDDFQVRTPTDILGQHIHLVKFDVTSSDGAGNGFNYEDGTFSPDEVQEIIHAINNGGSWTPCAGCGTATTLTPKPPPAEICNVPNAPAQCASQWKGAQTTIQRWYLDPVVDSQNVDRTLRTVFTHDHFGPSTHQQAGLYAGLLVEPKDSLWQNVDGSPMGGGPITQAPVRPDGGPTSWQANILLPTAQDSYREFMLEYQDLQLAYLPGSKTAPSPQKDQGWRDPSHSINAATFPEFNEIRPRLVSTGNIPITGTMSVNYRNEPISFRIGPKMASNPNPDLSYAFDNQQALKGDPNSTNPDPITPLMRAYQGDNVQVRVLVGAHVFAHQFNLMGPTWFAEPSWKNSGYRSSQPMGLSEHFELRFTVPSSSAPLPVAPATSVRKCPDGKSAVNCVDYFYSPSLDETGLAHGLWGIFRSYDPTAGADGLKPLPNNPVGPNAKVAYTPCKPGAPPRTFNISAITAQNGLATIPKFQVPGSNPPQGELIYNDRGPRNKWIGSLMGIMYVRDEDLKNGQIDPARNVPIEPLILRANAGDCITVKLTNRLAQPGSDLSQLKVYDHKFNWPSPFNGNNNMPGGWQQMSHFVGLHPQLLSYDAATSFGWNIGWNSKGRADQFANFGETVTYTWYAGRVDRDATTGDLTYTPVELGALNLFPSDPLFQHPNGLIGQMIIEPEGATWSCGEPGAEKPCDAETPVSEARPAGGTDGTSARVPRQPVAPADTAPTTRASATVKAGSVQFREFAVMISDALFTSDTTSAVNYGSEPKAFRYKTPGNIDYSCMTSNLLIQPTVNAPSGEPRTPIFRANVGDQVRFRMTHPMGTGDSQVFTVHGHAWQRNPYQKNSLIIGNNNLSQWLGSRDNHGSSDHFDLVIPQAGGTFGVKGDYLYTAYLADQASLGAWGVFRVGGDPTTTTPANAVCNNRQAPAAAAPRNDAQDLRKRFHRAATNAGNTNP